MQAGGGPTTLQAQPNPRKRTEKPKSAKEGNSVAIFKIRLAKLKYRNYPPPSIYFIVRKIKYKQTLVYIFDHETMINQIFKSPA